MKRYTIRFSAYLKNFPATDKPFDKVLIEYYTSALGLDLAMFAKAQVKPTLAETYEEAERVEVEKESIEDYLEKSGEKNFQEKSLIVVQTQRGAIT